MKKIVLLLIAASIVFAGRAQSVKSPGDFLGYDLGSRYTPHFRIVNYFRAVEEAVPSMVKLQQYGETNEKRPLLLAFVSSPDNLRRLESIRLNNLRLAHLTPDKMAPVEAGAPAIVWLSFNVHGNEASSSEAAMHTLFALVDPANAQTKEWLKNTVVVIDPCLNPDGRDRYVNWYSSVAGEKPDPNAEAREHHEPWPEGRTNHYNFDLNRDWAWQTQVESAQRVKVYREWVPQVHVDFHEQGINSPYYFAPAAQPYHDVITQWQRDFQVTIGKNHAKYFDANGWLYFTKEVFDLLYPSYGDTYPVCNGAIGMTYEQAGGGKAGLSALEAMGDTLTLRDRLIHHYTTAISTVEIASLNASKLITEFKKYFDDAVSKGYGDYKTFIIKNKPEDEQRIKSLIELLKKNGIEYGRASGNGKGFSYLSGREESFSISPGDIVVSAMQSKSALTKALFEPESVLVDSVTYDITAWSLPYVYGLQAYATRDRISVSQQGELFPGITNSANESYGYIIRWRGMQSARAVSQLMKKGIKLRYAEEPFEVSGEKFERGAVIILKTGNQGLGYDLWKTVASVCNVENIKMIPVSTGFVDKGYDFGSSKVVEMKIPKVALLTGEGISPERAGEIWHFFDKVIDYPVSLINLEDMANISRSAYDVIICPSGYLPLFNEKSSADELKDWISNGGKLIALEGAVSELSKLDWAIKAKKPDEKKNNEAEKESGYSNLKKYEDRERNSIPGSAPGSIYRVELDNTHPLAFGYPGYYYTLKQDDHLYEFFSNNGWNVGIVKKDQQVAGFVGSALKAKIKDGLLFGVQDIGRGTVIYLADDVLFRSFWDNGKLMFCNALFFVGQ